MRRFLASWNARIVTKAARSFYRVSVDGPPSTSMNVSYRDVTKSVARKKRAVAE